MGRLNVRVAAVVAALALIGAGAATGCSTGTVVDYPTPTVWTVSYMGQLYCPYQYDPHEIDMYPYTGPCERVPFPSLTLVPAPGTLEAALAGYWTTYPGFFESGYWYDQYYAPLGSRYRWPSHSGARYHVTVISRSSYLSNVSTFDRTYAGQIKNNSAKASWSGGKTGNYSFPSSNQKARNKPLTNVGTGSGTGGSNVGTPNSRDRSGPLTNIGSGGSTRRPPSSGKSGTRR